MVHKLAGPEHKKVINNIVKEQRRAKAAKRVYHREEEEEEDEGLVSDDEGEMMKDFKQLKGRGARSQVICFWIIHV